MGILFPVANDVFTEPSSPETTALSSAGTGSRNHNEHHRDLGDAVEKMQQLMALLDHSHDGSGGLRGTNKLKQVNTHESVDTDTALTAIHHTLGRSKWQAAPGDHKHTQADIEGLGQYICTSTTRPVGPPLGTFIFETDTNCVRVWTRWRSETNPRWVLLPVANIPICRLLQGVEQRILSSGTTMEWRVEEEDSFGMFDGATNMSEVVIPEAGLYSVDASVTWSPDRIFGDNAYTRILLNGQPTTRVHGEFVRGRGFTPGFSQSVDLSAKVRFDKNDRLAIRASHNGALASWTWSSTSAKQDSRLDVSYLSP